MNPQPPEGRGCLFSVLAVVGLGLVVMIAIVIAVFVTTSHSTPPGSGTRPHPAGADIAVTSCTVDPTRKKPVAKGRILNHSSGISDYTFTISFRNPAGSVIAQGSGVENNLPSQQATIFSVIGDKDVSGTVTCEVANVTRFASP